MNRAEILRYLRTSSKVDDDRLMALIDRCSNEVEKNASPKTIHRIFDCKVTKDTLEIDNVTFESKRLAENLEGCNRVCVFAATLGADCDRLIRAYSKTDMATAMVLQACLASKIEEVCDELENKLKAQGLKLRQRYSPGYFDLDITENRKLFELVDITKRIGLVLTDTCQMIPTKSVTAFIGIEDD